MVRLPGPDFVSVVPVRITSSVPLSAVSCESARVPPVSVPPATVTSLAIVRDPRLSVPPVLTVTAPEPKAAAAPAVSVPASMVVPPEKVLVPDSVTVPEVDFVTAPAPARMAETVPARRS